MRLLKNSFLVGIVLKICGFFANAYKSSRLAGCINAVGKTVRVSRTRKILSSYVNKKPFYEGSAIHKAVLWIFKAVDKPVGGLNRVLTALISGSRFCGGIINIYKDGKSIQALCLVACGIALVFVLKGSIVAVGILVAAAICAFFGSFKGVFKGCFVYRFICWLVKS